MLSVNCFYSACELLYFGSNGTFGTPLRGWSGLNFGCACPSTYCSKKKKKKSFGKVLKLNALRTHRSVHFYDGGLTNECFVLHVQFDCALLLLSVGGVLLFSLMTQ